MAEGEPLRKKQKKVEDDIFHIFHTFHDKYCADDMSILHTAYKTLFQKESSLITYSIRFCNAHQPVEFTDAYLDLEEHIDVIYPIGGIFESGLSVLRNFLMSKEIPEDRNIQRILSTLLTYLLDQDMMKPLDEVEKHCGSEQALTLLLLNHLLLPLIPSANCIVDGQTTWKWECPDKCGHLEGFGSSDTSIGNYNLWHGRINAIIGTPQGDAASALTVVQDDDGTGGPGYRSGIARAIVFSFLQGKLHPEWKTSMIPTIGLSQSELIVYFYDHKNDVLLKTINGLNFKEAGENRIKAILVAWLVINYKYLCSGFVDNLSTAPKANFFEACKDMLDLYRNNIRHGGVGNGPNNKEPEFQIKYIKSVASLPSGIDKIASIN